MRAAKTLPTQDRLRTLFDYHPDGYLVRRIGVGSQKGNRAGDAVCGTLNRKGYHQAKVDGVLYYLHRLIFQWHYDWCPKLIDHGDRDRGNCRIGNLEPTTYSKNALNTCMLEANTTGVSGVSVKNGRYQALVARDGVRRFLGNFDTVGEAASAIAAFDCSVA